MPSKLPKKMFFVMEETVGPQKVGFRSEWEENVLK